MNETIKFYLAPMEGLTGYVYRNAFHRHYGGADRYFTPFIANKKLSRRELDDILPEHNAGMNVIPQILTNRAEHFLCIARELSRYGYAVVNLNLGCPSGTVTARNRGAGFLRLPEELDRFLDNIFSACPLRISVKTRIGVVSAGEWEALLKIYEKYPVEELIIHPRLLKDYYQNKPDLNAFAAAVKTGRHSLCYNGDICTPEDFARIRREFPETVKIMIGRGVLKNPALIRQLRETADTPDPSPAGMPAAPSSSHTTSAPDRLRQLRAFHDDLLEHYLEILSGDRNTLFKMKELWCYLGNGFTSPEKYRKAIRKAEGLREYTIAVSALFRAERITTEESAGYRTNPL